MDYQFQTKVKTIKGRKKSGTQKEMVTELLGCVEHSTSPLNNIKLFTILLFFQNLHESDLQ
jgi:hypothetical protein